MAVPVEWLGNFQVNTGAAEAGSQLDPQIIGLANGNFIVAWTELVGGAIGTSAGQDIIGKIYDRDGNLVRDAFQLNTSNAVDDERDFDIAATSDGGFVMVYIDDDISDANQTSVIWQRYDASGNSIDSATVANELVAADFLANPNVAVDLTTNTSFVTYTDDVGVNSNVSGVVVSAAGGVGAEFFAAENSSEADANADIAVLSDGRIVTVYEETDATTVGGHVRVMNSVGTFLADFEFDNGALGDPKVASLANGGYIVTWTSTNENGNVAYKVYNSSNQIIGSGTQFGSDSTNEAEVVALRDGGAVILWDNDTDGTLEGLRIAASGAVDSGPFVIENAPTGVPGISATADGRLLLVWRETNGGGEIVAKIWDPRGGTVNAGDYDAFDRNFLATDTITGGAGPTAINSGDIDGVVLLGQAGNDTITGGIGAQTLRGAGGDDSISGGATPNIGADLFDGGDGFDTLIASSGDDTVLGGANSDTIDGGDGNDLLTGGLGADSVSGGGGNDTIAILDGEFIDNVDGGAADDLLDLSGIAGVGQGVIIDLDAGSFTGFGGTRTIADIEAVFGTGLDDIIELSTPAGVTIAGGGGDDSLTGHVSSDDLDGGDGDDTLLGGGGIDTLKGGAGNDLMALLGFEHIDHVDGGADIDTLDYSAMTFSGGPIALDLGAGTATSFGGTVSVANVERVIGTDFNDTLDGGGVVGVTLDGGLGDDAIDGGIDVQILVGGEGNDTIFADAGFLTTIGDYIEGRDGDDSLIGAGGFDTLLGGALNDTILGGGDSDSLSGEDGKDSLGGEEGQDTLSGGVGADALDGGEGDDDLLGGGGADTLEGGAGADVLDGGSASDWASYANASLKVRADLDSPPGNTGDAAGDSYNSIENLLGSAFNDALKGSKLDNILDGGDGNDKIDGRKGDDTLIGRDGQDTLTGGTGADQFLLTTIGVGGPDRIGDFAPGEDVIALKGAIFGLAPGALDPDAFVLASSAQDAEDRLIYNAANGKLFFDADGAGGAAQVQIATLINLAALAAADFIVV